MHKLPRSAAEIAPLLEDGATVCIAYFTMHDARSIEASRPDHERLLEELERRGRIRLGASESVSEFWLSAESPGQ